MTWRTGVSADVPADVPVAATLTSHRRRACVRGSRATMAVCLLSLTAVPTTWAQTAGRSPAECRTIVATLAETAPDSAWYRALTSVYDCPDQVGPALVALWRDPPRDSVRRRLVYEVSGHVRDARLFRHVVAVASDTAAPDSLRFRALEALVPWADPRLSIRVRPERAIPDSGTLRPGVGMGGFSHTFVRYGRTPLPRRVRDSVLAVLRQRGERDPSYAIRYVARQAVSWLELARGDSVARQD